ncbi:MAG: tRNA dihydrouridine synthase DusB, partial [Clostridia bacterium]|nr:tRNA dihydrouridine synthase DusB [Clostridia bacterium]
HIRNSDTPIGIQIFGSEPDIMAECAYLISTGTYAHAKSDTPPNYIDINMGCPVKKIVSNGEGSALLKNPDLCGQIVKKCVEVSKVPVTVKIRAGWDKDSINAVEVAKIVEANGASAVTIHGRTRAQMYEPYADWDIIKKVKNAINIPVIGNGDIFTAQDAIRMYEETGVDSVMIGRGALGNPFIFEEIKYLLEKKTYTPPTISQKIATARKQVALMIEDKGEQVAICEARKHLAWYIKGLHGCTDIKVAINKATTFDELNEILTRYVNELK